MNTRSRNVTQVEEERKWKIYKIVNRKEVTTIYIGSTIRELHVRMESHRQEVKIKESSTQKNNWMLENWDDLDIIEIGRANSKSDALSLERLEIEKHSEQGYNVINMILPGPPPPPKAEHITYEQQYRRCNKPSCSTCKNGQGHGPYWYAFWRDEKSKLKSAYIGKEKRGVRQ